VDSGDAACAAPLAAMVDGYGAESQARGMIEGV
jgi:hypothetical protein